MTEKRTILIVDDTPENIDVLNGILKEAFKIKAALNGEKALKIACGKNPPDLILLDVMMPGMDGYDVCRMLKRDKATRGIPVIFVTAKKEVEDETKGLDLGAVDYITKPVKPAVVRARVHTQIELKLHRDHMEALAEARAQQLFHAERLSTLGMLSAGVAHEINNPLTYIRSFSENIRDDMDDLEAALARALEEADPEREAIDEIISYCRESISEVINGSERIAALVKNMRHLSRRDDHTKTQIDLSQCLDNAMTLCQFDLKHIVVTRDIAGDLPRVLGNAQQIEQVLINLFRNAVDAMAPVETPELKIRAVPDKGCNRIIVADNGPGIEDDKLLGIWEPFYTTKADGKGTGLGLSISKGIVENHGGRIRAENGESGGACFIVELPFAEAPEQV